MIKEFIKLRVHNFMYFSNSLSKSEKYLFYTMVSTTIVYTIIVIKIIG